MNGDKYGQDFCAFGDGGVGGDYGQAIDNRKFVDDIRIGGVDNVSTGWVDSLLHLSSLYLGGVPPEHLQGEK